mmetsp:Transcript_9716/g.18407  ORF Transcript_9716/g.18407 Transcript_9716/m.18407 type:complete len:232 (+) Transcript_9716:714-1409(+)
MSQQHRNPGEHREVERPEHVKQFVSLQSLQIQQSVVDRHHPQHNKHAQHLRLRNGGHSAQRRQDRILEGAQRPVASDEEEKGRCQAQRAQGLGGGKGIAVHARVQLLGESRRSANDVADGGGEARQRGPPATHERLLEEFLLLVVISSAVLCLLVQLGLLVDIRSLLFLYLPFASRARQRLRRGSRSVVRPSIGGRARNLGPGAHAVPVAVTSAAAAVGIVDRSGEAPGLL